MSFTRFIRTAAMIGATLISASFAQSALAQGTFAQPGIQEPIGPIINGPVVYPDYCKPPNKVVLATEQVFTCAWSISVPDDVDPENLAIPYIVTREACAPNAYWNGGPTQTGGHLDGNIYWLEISCFHKGR